MTNLEGLPSYFWLVSPRFKKPVQDDVPYTTEALKQALLRLQIAWDDCQASRDRDAIYGYLTAVFDLVAWWAGGKTCSGTRTQGSAIASYQSIRKRGAVCRSDPLYR